MKNIIILFSICLLAISGFSFAGESGSIAPGPFPGAGMSSPVVKSKFFVLEAEVKKGIAHVNLPLDTPRKGIVLVLGESSVRALTAAQQALEPHSFTDEELGKANLPTANTRFNLDTLSSGMQTLTFYDIKNTKYVRMVISQTKSPLEMRVQVTPMAPRSGETVTITAQIKDKQLPQEAAVKASLPDGRTISLMDNGQKGDEAADDGVYTGTFIAPGTSGFQGMNIRFTAEGKRFNGIDFRRNAINRVMVTNPTNGILKQKISVNPKEIIVPLKAAHGRYRVEIIFGFNETTLAYSRENINQTGTACNVRLPLPPEALAANRAVVRLLNKDTLGLEEEFEINLIPTQAPPDFEAYSSQTPQMPDSKIKAAEKIKNNEKDGHHH